MDTIENNRSDEDPHAVNYCILFNQEIYAIKGGCCLNILLSDGTMLSNVACTDIVPIQSSLDIPRVVLDFQLIVCRILLAENNTVDLSRITTTNFKVSDILEVVSHTNFKNAFMIPHAMRKLRLMKTKELAFD